MEENDARSELPAGWSIGDFRWRAVGAGYLISLAVTLLAGIPLLILAENAWLLAAAGTAALLAGGFVVGRWGGRKLAVLNGALMAILYYLTLSLAFFVGSLLELLPEPLPGLPQGDSTFYFAWPLAQLIVGIVGAAVGVRFAISDAEGEG